jgi:hypothetical protein
MWRGISAGVGALTPAVPALHAYTLWLCLGILAGITVIVSVALDEWPNFHRRHDRTENQYRLFRFLRCRSGAKQVAQRRHNLNMVANDFHDRQQRRREQRSGYAPQPVPEHQR